MKGASLCIFGRKEDILVEFEFSRETLFIGSCDINSLSKEFRVILRDYIGSCAVDESNALLRLTR